MQSEIKCKVNKMTTISEINRWSWGTISLPFWLGVPPAAVTSAAGGWECFYRRLQQPLSSVCSLLLPLFIGQTGRQHRATRCSSVGIYFTLKTWILFGNSSRRNNVGWFKQLVGAGGWETWIISHVKCKRNAARVDFVGAGIRSRHQVLKRTTG